MAVAADLIDLQRIVRTVVADIDVTNLHVVAIHGTTHHEARLCAAAVRTDTQFGVGSLNQTSGVVGSAAVIVEVEIRVICARVVLTHQIDGIHDGSSAHFEVRRRVVGLDDLERVRCVIHHSDCTYLHVLSIIESCPVRAYLQR